jgi:cell division protein FtsB
METRGKILFLLAMALALGFIAYTLMGPGGGSKRTHLKSQLENIQRENIRLADQNRRLSMEIEALKKRQDYLEKVAREELGLIRPDEVVIHLPRSQDAGSVSKEDRPVHNSPRDGNPESPDKKNVGQGRSADRP